jgi:predicted dehydrogenase
MTRRVRLGIVGGRRGGSFRRVMTALADKVELTAICDLSEAVVAGWQTEYPQVRGFTRYDDLLTSGACDAVLLATPLQLHARQAVAAMRAGLDVLSEVIAATTLDECWELVETVEATGRTYMLAENYTYMRPNMLVRRLVDADLFGQLTYAEGAYIHDCRHLMFDEQGGLTWRGELRHLDGNIYPTHSLGPVAQWFGINRTDRLVETLTWTTPAVARQLYAEQRFGPDHARRMQHQWVGGDSATTLVRTGSGAVIVLRVDSASPRPHNMTHYVLQGTRAAYVSGRHGAEDPLIWIDGRSPGHSPPDAAWEPLWRYADEFEHPRWRERGATALQSGHGGGDFFVIEDFVDAIRTGSPPPIDVYDAVTWSAVTPLSIESVAAGGRPVAVPDFQRRRPRVADSQPAARRQ